MVIDTSALLAIFLNEPERQLFLGHIVQAESRSISAATVVEAGIVLEARLGDDAGRELDLFLYRAAIQIIPVDADQAAIARAAWRKFGKSRHPAALNLGDCFSYALAQATGEALLAKGLDFPQTGLPLVDLSSASSR